MRDLLVSYLLGETTDEEGRLVEESLARDPKLRRQLEHLRRCLHAEDDSVAAAPPSGLAERAVQRVKYLEESADGNPKYANPEYGDPDEGGRFSSLGFVHDANAHGSGQSAQWSVVDMIVAAGVVAAVGMLLLPALRESRSVARLNQCQNNLKVLGRALAEYSDNNHCYFPTVYPGENAGIFALRLLEGGYVAPEDLASLLVCPAAPLADELGTQRLVIQVRSADELRGIRGVRRFRIQRMMGGSYAYRFGYLKGGHYLGIRNRYKADVPVLADAPRIRHSEYQSFNHGGSGQNVLHQNLSVKFQKGHWAPNGYDHLFLNAAGRHAAGYHPHDYVLGRSEATPRVSAIGWTP